jgi:predicted ATP-grasp superfamily ATP-dependent carboligase
MSDAYRMDDLPELTSPVLLVALEGWIDAAQAAQTAVQSVMGLIGATPAVTFDPDLFLDYRARRPTTHLRDGVVTGMTWPGTFISHGRDADGADVLVLHGAEPDANWRRFLEATSSLIEQLSVRLVIGLGAYPVAVPHTRPSRVIATSADRDLALQVGVVNVAIDLPGGLATALEQQCAEKGVPAMALWAQIPHYATGLPSSAGALSLVETVNRVAGLQIGTAALRSAAETQRTHLDQLIANSTEHAAMVRAMEQQYDTEAPETAPTAGDLGDIPSGDELAAELERFLREQDT